ncbi:MAG: YIP1 family protein [Clostridia bacterium]|nr:YIP1 family protein [Clostridia bacterium]
MMTMNLNNVLSKLIAFKNRLVEGKKNPFLMLNHPFDTVDDIKQKRNGSRFYASLLLIAYCISAIISDVGTSFMYSTLRIKDFNILITLATSGMLVLLFVVGNWAISTLFSAEGRMSDVYVITCYNLTPLIAYNLVSAFLSNYLLPDEFVFVSILGTVCSIWFVALMFIGIMTIHNYSFKGTLINLLFSLVAMAVIFFLMFLFIVLMQQLYVFIMTVYTECRMRMLT